MKSESEIYNAARKLIGSAREQFLESECGSNPDLKRKVEALLDAVGGLDATQSSFGHSDDIDATQQHESVDGDSFSLGATQDSGTASPTAAGGDFSVGDSIGPYRLLQPLGQGGMGEVWIAEQSNPVKRRVALKVIKGGVGSREVIARFEAERQAVSMMNHPNIARILDAGATDDGQPYFVMELVNGKPLTTYCDQNKVGIEERLRLFTDVCAGVQHAHQKGIIHRDLKPGNIIVGIQDGKAIPKVIDFGLAKAMESTQRLTDQSLFTGIGQILGTLKYMSPEQASLDAIDIDTRTDVYALGVILYELLTGSTPLDDSSIKEQAALKVLEFIREKEPVKPSSKLSSSTDEETSAITNARRTDSVRLNRILAGDLDWIVMKALEKDRTRRYESASSFADDILRYLNNDPVEARPPSLRYRTGKFVRKNRLVVAAACLLTVSLLTGLVTTRIQMQRALIAESLAEGRLNDVKNALSLAESRRQESEVAKADAVQKQIEAERQKERAIDREKLAISAVKRFSDAITENPQLKKNSELSSLRKKLLKEPLNFFSTLREQLLDENDAQPASLVRLATASFSMGMLTQEIGEQEDSLMAFKESLQTWEKLTQKYPNSRRYKEGLASSYLNLGVLHARTGHPDEGLAALKQAIAIKRQLILAHPKVAEFHASLAGLHHNVAQQLLAIGKIREALDANKSAIEIQERLVEDNPGNPVFRRDLASSLIGFGVLLFRAGSPSEGLDANQKAIEILEGLVLENPSDSSYQGRLAMCLFNIGKFYLRTGESQKALEACQRAREVFAKLNLENPSNIEFMESLATTNQTIGVLMWQTGKAEKGLEALQIARNIGLQLVNENPGVTDFQASLASVYSNIGMVLRSTGRMEEAFSAFQNAILVQERHAIEFPDRPAVLSGLAATLHNMASLDINANRFVEAKAKLERALEAQKRALSINPKNPVYRQFFQNHNVSMITVALELEETELLDKAERQLAEIAIGNPAANRYEDQLADIEASTVDLPPLGLVELANYAYSTRRFAHAAFLFHRALELEPKFANDRSVQLPYNAACAAALAGSGRGIDEPKRFDLSKTTLRSLALRYLNSELDAWQALLNDAPVDEITTVKTAVRKAMANWKTDTDLFGVRGARISKLPIEEQSAWNELWDRAEELRKLAQTIGDR